MNGIEKEAIDIFEEAVSRVLPGGAVRRALSCRAEPSGRRILLAVGKAAWTMARAAFDTLAGNIDEGIVITKYGHSRGPIPGLDIYEAAHPLPDENTYAATERALNMTRDLSPDDEVLFLLSGGGSALFEKPMEGVFPSDIVRLGETLLACGASIGEINTLRKRFSSVKGGRFAHHCLPAQIFQIVLSDVLGDRLESIASGPACADQASAEEARAIATRYRAALTEAMEGLIRRETPKVVSNVETRVTGSVAELCRAAGDAARQRGFSPHILTTTLDCEAREAGRFAAALAREAAGASGAFAKPCALIMGGETVVTLRGNGKGGRNQELALAAAEGIRGLENAAILSAGSDGTDGPTDAAGGVVNGRTWNDILACGIDPTAALENNDSWNALRAADALVVTGPTGTNVNDLVLLLLR